ncbi:hypothetical protein WJX74_002038 [Apatococcus lobatus]|uniref:Bud22 domain-containing protein n=1 Tax=Apatococcus lobatus TaxID=904363 RepID=A0AAW1Q550_9CHLO
MVRAKAPTGPRAQGNRYAGSQKQRQAQTRAQLRVLQKALKKARDFETRKVLRRLKAAQEACNSGEPEAEATYSKCLSQKTAIKRLSMDKLSKQAGQICGVALDVSRPISEGVGQQDKRLQSATSGAVTSAPEAPVSAADNIAIAHQQLSSTERVHSDNQMRLGAPSAAFCSAALGTAADQSGQGHQGQAAGADAQALQVLATRIMSAKCVQEAMQSVQAQHARHARQAAKLNTQPGQASAPGEGRRQRSRKHKLEGVSDQHLKQKVPLKILDENGLHDIKTNSASESQQRTQNPDSNSQDNFSSGDLQQSGSESGEETSHHPHEASDNLAQRHPKDLHLSSAETSSLSNVSGDESDEEIIDNHPQRPITQEQGSTHSGKQPCAKAMKAGKKQPARKKNRLGQRARKQQALMAERPARDGRCAGGSVQPPHFRKAGGAAASMRHIHPQDHSSASKATTKVLIKGAGLIKGLSHMHREPLPSHPSWQAKRAMARAANPLTASKGSKIVFD